jgi:hypothetical protein
VKKRPPWRGNPRQAGLTEEHILEDPTPSEEPTQEATESTEPTPTEDRDSEEPTETEEPTSTSTETDSEDSEDPEETERTSSRKPKPTNVDPRLPPGGIKMVTPADMVAQPTYIKIGDNATFVWNYTSLIITPTAVDVVAYRRSKDLYYTITGNQSVQETGSVIWNTAEYLNDEQPLEEDIYTFMVYDVAAGPTAMPSAGHLGVSPQNTFGIYKPQSYTPLSGMICHPLRRLYKTFFLHRY